MVISEGLKRAIEEKDIVAVRSSFYTIILSDPMFRTSKFDETLKYVKKQKLEGLMDDYDGEKLKPEEEWTEEYFDILASKLQDNFSDERIAQIKKVAGSLDMSERRQPKETHDGKYDWLTVLGIVLVVVSLIRRLFKGGK